MRAKHFLPEAPIGLSNKRPARAGSRPDRGHDPVPLYKDQTVAEAQLGTALQWPEVVNKVNSAMKATGWKGSRKGDDAYIFSSKGQETDDQYYFVIIDNAGEGFFTYALGTVEEGDPYIDDAYKGTLPNTEASISELINSIRDGFGLNESLHEGKTQKQEAPKVRNFVAKNATTSGAGAHKDKKKAAKQGDVKHKNKSLELAEMEDILEKASLKLCKSSTPDEDLGASNLASCKSQGLRARDGKKSHKLGKSAKSRVTMDGHKIKGNKYGGPLPDWS